VTTQSISDPAPQPGRTVMVRDMVTDTDLELPLAELLANDERYRLLVWDDTLGEFATIHRLAAAAAMLGYADTLGPGTWACWTVSARAMELFGDDAPWDRRIRRPSCPG
jgi:hypothetical protein